MKNRFPSLIVLYLLLTSPCTIMVSAKSLPDSNRQTLQSPDGRLELIFDIIDGIPIYALNRDGKSVIQSSRMGFTLEWRDDLSHAFVLRDVHRSTFDEIWQPVWGEESNIRNHYNEMLVTLEQPIGSIESMDHSTETRPTVMLIRFRLYDDGLGFRYEFPSNINNSNIHTIPITEGGNHSQFNALVCFWFKDELTEFALTGNHTAWWIPGDYDTQEFNYTESRLSQIDSLYDESHKDGGWPWTGFSRTGVQTALQMKTDDGLYINIHEAATLNFPTLHLELTSDTHSRFNRSPFVLQAHLCPDAAGYKGRLQTPCHTPWRTIMVCEKATDVLRSRLILNLNDPCTLNDVSWIHPVKYMGVWWEMITAKSTWSYTNDYPSVKLGETDYLHATSNGTHGANNTNVRRYIDFAANHGFDALLVEGWNIGWEDWYGKQKDIVFDFVTPYPDFDLPALNRYAHEHGIRLIMHHESSASTINYERWMEKAYTLMNQYGYNTVKSGYVGTIIPFAEGHYSQPINNHYHHAIVEAAKHHIMVNAHEAVRPTGLCRTWPNMIGNESAMGTEFQERIHPGHATILPFTRLQGGPMDYTPGIFEPDISKIIPWGKPMQHTICNQLGLYVTLYSPLQMAADFPEHYVPFLDAFQFIKDVAVDWDTSLYLYAEPGAYIVTARKAKTSSLNKAADGIGKLPDGKKGVISNTARFIYDIPDSIQCADLSTYQPKEVWYIGGITDETARDFTIKLNFLQSGKTYDATIYADGKDANGLTGADYNPQSYTITTKKVSSKTALKIHAVPCGGFAISIRERKQ